jgi:small subunit ribosomal protein S2
MKEEKLWVDQDDYLKSGIHIGTKIKTKFMVNFIYKIRADGLSILNVDQINHRLGLMIKMISEYGPKDILVVCRRENGFNAVKLFSKLTGIDAFVGRYKPGILTNVELEDFQEKKLIIVCDPSPDRNVVTEASKAGIPVVALCDTNNNISNIDLVMPCNNKGRKSLGLIFYVLAKEYLDSRKLIKSKDFKHKIEDFVGE